MKRDGCFIHEFIQVVSVIPEKPNPNREPYFDRSRRRRNVLENEIRRFVPGLGGKTCNRIAGLYFNRLLRKWCSQKARLDLTDCFYLFIYLLLYFLATFNSNCRLKLDKNKSMLFIAMLT